MIKKNPYLKMEYNTKTNKLAMTPQTLEMWLKTWEILSDKQKEQILKTLNYFTEEKEK